MLPPRSARLSATKRRRARRQNRAYPSFCEAALHVKPRLTPSSFGLGTAMLREVVHPSVRALGGEARSPAHGGVRWGGGALFGAVLDGGQGL